jgi:secreted PhoX family phosphatase
MLQDPSTKILVSGNAQGASTAIDSLPVLTDEWLPPADSNLAVDSQNNIWITTADKRNENRTDILVGIIDPAGSLTANNAFAVGEDPVISSGANKIAIGWTEGSNLNLAVANSGLSS